MAGKEDFSAVEWLVISELPVVVVSAAAAADSASGIGSMLEMVTALSQLSNGAMERGDSPLVSAVFEEYKDDGQGEARTLELSQHGVDNIVPIAIERAAQAAAILANRTTPEEADLFKGWLLDAAEAVCAAARTGGFMGLGGARISEPEAAFLADLTEAFSLLPADAEDNS